MRGQVGSRKRLSSSWFSGLDFGNLIVYPVSSNHSSNVMSRIWKDCSHCCMKKIRKFSLVNKENVLGRASSTLLRIKICGIFALRSQHTNVSFDLEVSNFFLSPKKQLFHSPEKKSFFLSNHSDWLYLERTFINVLDVHFLLGIFNLFCNDKRHLEFKNGLWL